MSEADTLRDKTEDTRDIDRGVPTTFRPKRKRGYHRAIKRGEMWAVVEQGYVNMKNSLVSMMFRDVQDLVYIDNPFLNLIRKD